MTTVDSLLSMERCASCDRELAATWKFCIYCGRPFVAATSKQIRDSFAEAGNEQRKPPQRKNDGAFWVGVGMGVLGLVLIIYAAIQIYS